MPRIKRFNQRKKKFCGVKKEKPKETVDVESRKTSISQQSSLHSARDLIPCSSASRHKLSRSSFNTQMSIKVEQEFERDVKGFCLIDKKCLSQSLEIAVTCKICKDGPVKLTEARKRKGLAHGFSFECQNCEKHTKFSSSTKLTSGFSEANARYVLPPSLLYKKLTPMYLKTFCASMDRPSPPAQFQRMEKILSPAHKKASMTMTAEEAILDNKDYIESAGQSAYI